MVERLCRHERYKDANGVSMNQWYLVDQHGKEHLAMIGKEREARDGHYTYSAQEPYATMKAASCTNQTQVVHWLEHFLTHHAPESHLHVGDHIHTVQLLEPSGKCSEANLEANLNMEAFIPGAVAKGGRGARGLALHSNSADVYHAQQTQLILGCCDNVNTNSKLCFCRLQTQAAQ
jgi:hypothetical protein